MRDIDLHGPYLIWLCFWICFVLYLLLIIRPYGYNTINECEPLYKYTYGLILYCFILGGVALFYVILCQFHSICLKIAEILPMRQFENGKMSKWVTERIYQNDVYSFSTPLRYINKLMKFTWSKTKSSTYLLLNYISQQLKCSSIIDCTLAL